MKRMSSQILESKNMLEKQETEEDHSLKTQKNIIDYIDDDNNKKCH